tara:strand:+ start:7142 stop:8764 length:1623 start_codon:yes stop_codon:yes gene_type:complete
MKFLKFTLFYLLFGTVNCQNLPKINSGVISSTISIGEQINYFLNVEVDSVQIIEFPEKLKIAPMELLEIFPTDTQKVKNRYLLTKKYSLIQFDSGYYSIPPQRVLINGFSKLSDSVKIEIKDIIVDTLKQNLFQIKPLNIVKKNYNSLIKRIIYSVLFTTFLIISIYLILVYQRKISGRKKIIPPFERAIKALKELEKRDPKIQEDYKRYYSELTDVVRRYIEEEVNIDALESTSDQLLLKLELQKKHGKLNLEETTIKNLKTVLKTADLVKFARAIPDTGAVKLDRKLLEDVVIETKEVLPQPTIEELKAKKDYEELLKKEKRKKIIKWIISLVLALSFLSIISLILIFGYYPVRDTLLGYPTKKLINKEWFNSQYGSPPIQLITPSILKRKIIKQKTSSLFVMDSIQSKYYIELFFEKKNKSDLNQNSQVDNNTSGKEKTQQILDQTIERYQSQGAVNILMDAENYETSSGLPTLKISGTLDISKTKKGEKVRCFFTTLIVDYEEGKVSLTLIYDKDDRYGDEISKKIIDSIELIKEL